MAREIQQERRTVELLEALGFVPRKDGREGWPDRCVFVGHELHIWIEHKTEVGQMTAAQKRVFPKLEMLGETILYAKGMTPDQIATAVKTWAMSRRAFKW